MEETSEIIQSAIEALKLNDQGLHTIPAEGLYPHQWFWDSCFVAIGISHYDVNRAQTEIKSLLKGQWANGMIPNTIFLDGREHYLDREMWRSWLNPFAPDDVSTSGITQPPMLAEAIVRIGKRLSKAERRTWYNETFVPLVNFHKWLYKERDPHDEGLVVQVHPWETGLDNSPPAMIAMRDNPLPLWVSILSSNFFKPLIKLIRRDTKYVRSGERLSNFEAVSLYAAQRRLRRQNYDIKLILKHPIFAIEDLTYNSILIRANSHLKEIAKYIGKDLPKDLAENMAKSEAVLETLWDEQSMQYYSRNFISRNLIRQASIATLMPLYSGAITQDRAKELVEMLHKKEFFNAKFPVPSVPLSSTWFNEHRYWQGPTWINTNWLIIDGLERYSFSKEAEHIKLQTIQLVKKHDYYEYFSPKDGSPAGSKNLSWSSALVIDLLS